MTELSVGTVSFGPHNSPKPHVANAETEVETVIQVTQQQGRSCLAPHLELLATSLHDLCCPGGKRGSHILIFALL